MASRFSVSAVFSAIDKMTGPVKRMADNNSRFTKQIRRDYALAARSAERFTKSIGKKAGAAMKRTAQIGGAALAGGLALATKQYIDFDDAIFGATAKMGDLDITTAQGQKTMEEMRKTARQVGAETQFSAVEAAQGLEFLAMAGFTADQSMKLLPGVANLATVANVDFARATDIASDALGAFGKMTTDTEQLSKNFLQVQDQMATTVTKTNTTMEDLFESIKFGAPAFTAAGQEMSTYNAIVGRMASSGIKGSNAGTAMRSAITRLQKPTKEVTDGLAMYGLSMDKIVKDGKLMDMVDIMGMMETNGKKMTAVQRNAALTMIVGKNAVSGWAAVMNEGVINTRQLKETLDKSNGAAQQMSNIIRQSLGNKVKAIFSALTDKAFSFLSAFDGAGRAGIDSFIEAIRNFDVTPIVDGFKAVFTVISFVYGIIKPFLPLLLGFIAAWKVYQMTLVAVQVAQTILNLVMAANPIGLIIIGVALLVMWFMNLVEKTGSVKNAFLEIGKAIMRYSLIPLNLMMLGIEKLLLLLSKLPIVGSKMKSAAESVRGFREGINKPFESSIGGTNAPITQREAVQTSIEKRTTENTLNIRNASKNDVDTGGQRIAPGMSMRVLPQSG